MSLLRSVSHGFWVNSWSFRGQSGREGTADLLPKTLNSFSGFVWLAQILRTFTFCGELLRINGIARNLWMEPQECRRFYIYRDVGPLTLPSIGPVPLRHPADPACDPQRTSTQSRRWASQPAAAQAFYFGGFLTSADMLHIRKHRPACWKRPPSIYLCIFNTFIYLCIYFFTWPRTADLEVRRKIPLMEHPAVNVCAYSVLQKFSHPLCSVCRLTSMYFNVFYVIYQNKKNTTVKLKEKDR